MRRKNQPNFYIENDTNLRRYSNHRNSTSFHAYELSRNWVLALLVLTILQFGHFVDCRQDVTQMSPKSNSHMDVVASQSFLTSTTTDHQLPSNLNDVTQSDTVVKTTQIGSEENATHHSHIRVERSALPIVNEKYPKSGHNSVQFKGESEKEAAAGRYFQYDIKPTSTFNQKAETDILPTTKKIRAGKSADAAATSAGSSTGSFLVNGDLRQPLSGSQSPPSKGSTVKSTAATAIANPHNARQNSNPDIQDIITGIVKLLNGNVNVHANTQGVRRPTASRINNRGPPRISEVQPLPMEYDGQKPQGPTSMRPPPYPFDRPERPFITGVPIPEQIVPLRPGFISNRPPWHRNKPRPPITTSIGGRRPIPQYKPMPSSQMQPPQDTDSSSAGHDSQMTGPLEVPTTANDFNDTLEGPSPTDTSYDSEFSNEDVNTQYIEVSDNDSEILPSNKPSDEMFDSMKPPQFPTAPAPVPTQEQSKKDESSSHANKKKPNKHKNHDKKKNSQDHMGNVPISSSEIHTAMNGVSTYIPMPMDTTENIGVNLATDEIIFMTASRTPELETVTTKHLKTKSSSNSQTSPTKVKSSIISTKPLTTEELADKSIMSASSHINLASTIVPTLIASVPITTSTTSTTTSTTTTTTETVPTSKNKNHAHKTTPTPTVPTVPGQYQPRPGIVLDDPEFQPGGRPRPQRPAQAPQLPLNPAPPVNIQPTRQQLPPGYGEIFDVTLSAIQGPGSQGGSQQTINIKPFGSYGSGGGAAADIIVSASDPPTGVQMSTPATDIPQLAGAGSSTASTPTSKPSTSSGGGGGGGSGGVNPPVTQQNTPGSGYGVAETEVVDIHTNKPQHIKPPVYQSTTTNSGPSRPQYRPKTTQPPVRIDTCIVGDDSTCDQAQHEHCKTENGVSSCHCRPGHSRRKHREPCRRVITFYIGMRVDRIYEHRIVWDNKLSDRTSEPYGQLSFESIRAIDSAMSMTPYSDEFMEAKVNNIYRGDPNLGGSGVFVNMTIKLDESVETLRPNLRSDVQKHLLGVLHRRNNNIGNSVLYVNSPEGAISALRDFDECEMAELNDCHPTATCTNSFGSYSCSCPDGTKDAWSDQPYRAGRECQTCPESYCNNRGTCSYNDDGNQICTCDSSHYGGQCEIDGEVLGVAIGASVAAVIIIVLTLICLIMWSRRWQREQKNAIGSPVFGYMNTAPLKSAVLPQPGYQVTLEDRMRWAQIADVMAQTNHYGAEPIGGPTRPSSAMFAYPNLQTLGMGTIGGMSMQSTMQQMHHVNAMAPPVPLPRYERLGLNSRSNGMRTLENSSSSEEEDRTDLLGRNFQVPRPKSRSNNSITNQSGIYYDVDYEPSANGIGSTSVDRLYGSQNQSTTHSHISNSHIPGPQGIPMSTYTSGRAPNSYYMK